VRGSLEAITDQTEAQVHRAAGSHLLSKQSAVVFGFGSPHAVQPHLEEIRRDTEYGVRLFSEEMLSGDSKRNVSSDRVLFRSPKLSDQPPHRTFCSKSSRPSTAQTDPSYAGIFPSG